MEEKRETVTAPEEELTSASARIMRGLGLDKKTEPEIEVEPVGFFENYWYHHKWKTIIIGVALLIVMICTVQMCAKETPDVYLMYAGPGFLTANEAREVQNSFRQIMDDYNEAMMGKVLDVLVDGYDEEAEQFFGRSYADSPDIDGRVWIGSDEPLREGQFVKVQIDGTVDGDLSGFVMEE